MITGGIKAISQEQSFWSGAWKGAVVGAVGGMSAMIGGGPFLQNVLWGAGGGGL